MHKDKRCVQIDPKQGFLCKNFSFHYKLNKVTAMHHLMTLLWTIVSDIFQNVFKSANVADYSPRFGDLTYRSHTVFKVTEIALLKASDFNETFSSQGLVKDIDGISENI